MHHSILVIKRLKLDMTSFKSDWCWSCVKLRREFRRRGLSKSIFPQSWEAFPRCFYQRKSRNRSTEEWVPRGHWRRLCSIWATIRFVTDHIHFPGLIPEYWAQRKFCINFYFGKFTFTGKALFQISWVIHRPSLNGRRLLDILEISPCSFKYHFFSSNDHLWIFNLINQSQV